MQDKKKKRKKEKGKQLTFQCITPMRINVRHLRDTNTNNC